MCSDLVKIEVCVRACMQACLRGGDCCEPNLTSVLPCSAVSSIIFSLQFTFYFRS
uniref:Uncharacterized protein n=1 Tax=Anguilla anguilla TaxID=7936 RepID=A0A0E9WJP6_ANGAN